MFSLEPFSEKTSSWLKMFPPESDYTNYAVVKVFMVLTKGMRPLISWRSQQEEMT